MVKVLRKESDLWPTVLKELLGKKVLLTRFMIMRQKDSTVFRVQFGQTLVLREVFQSHVLDHISEMIWQIFSLRVLR